MGYYIDRDSKGTALTPKDKAVQLVNDGAKIVGWQIGDRDYRGVTAMALPLQHNLPEFQDNLVCVVMNQHFDAAAYVYSQEEMDYMATMSESDQRMRIWLTYEPAKVASGFIPKGDKPFAFIVHNTQPEDKYGFGSRGFANGYVGVDRDHPWYGRECEDFPVFEGVEELTFSGMSKPVHWKKAELLEPIDDGKEYWVLGFDTRHSWNSIEKDTRESVIAMTQRLKAEAEKAAYNI
jgi:hypothetical protein